MQLLRAQSLPLITVFLLCGCSLFDSPADSAPPSTYYFQGNLGGHPFTEVRKDTIKCYEGSQDMVLIPVFCGNPGEPDVPPPGGTYMGSKVVETGYYLLDWKQPETDSTWIRLYGPNQDNLVESNLFQATSISITRMLTWKLSGNVSAYADFAEAKAEQDKETFFIELKRPTRL
jgi:hypothetical protein